MTRLEKSLPQPEVFYRSLLESAGYRVWVVDREGRYLFVNEPVERKLGLKREEILRKTYGDLHSAKDNRDFLERVKRVFGDEVVTYEYFFPRNRRWSLRTMSPVREPSGEIIAVSILSKDITERKKAEEKLKEYADNLGQLVRERTKEIRFLSNIAASISQSIMVQDNNRKIVYVNKAFEDMYGYSKEEVIGKPASMLAPEGMADEIHCEITRGLEARGYWSGEILRRRKNGEVFPVQTSVSYLRNENGKIIGRFGVSTDITEKKKLENRLQRSEERLRSIFDNVPIGIIMTDEHGNYIEVNAAQRKLSRAPREELLRQNYHDQRDRTLQPFFKKALQGEAAEHEGWYTTTARGLTYWVRTIFTPIFDHEGKVDGIIILSEDRTERKRLEEQLLEQTRLGSIGATAAMVGHDLRNPLQAIVNNIYLAKKTYDAAPATFKRIATVEGLVERFNAIEDEAQYMNKIVSDLQDYARPLKPELSETNLLQLINEAFSTIPVPETVKVSMMIQHDFPKLMIDPTLMRRVFTNLITNAIQAMPDGGQLTMRLSKTEEAALISIQDTGIGIPGENLPRLFQPLFTTKAKGQGLGLAVCKRFVEAHGGEVKVESKIGEGSVFTVRIPLKREVSSDG